MINSEIYNSEMKKIYRWACECGGDSARDVYFGNIERCADSYFVKANEEVKAHYEYEEWQMSKEQYEVYKGFEDRINEQADAITQGSNPGLLHRRRFFTS